MCSASSSDTTRRMAASVLRSAPCGVDEAKSITGDWCACCCAATAAASCASASAASELLGLSCWALLLLLGLLPLKAPLPMPAPLPSGERRGMASGSVQSLLKVIEMGEGERFRWPSTSSCGVRRTSAPFTATITSSTDTIRDASAGPMLRAERPAPAPWRRKLLVASLE